MKNDADEVFSILDEFGIMNIDEYQIISVKRGDLQALGEEFSNLLVLNDSSDQRLIQLEKILLKYAGSTKTSKNKNTNKNKQDEIDEDINEGIFWSALIDRNIPPVMLQALCFMLLGNESLVFNHGIILYSILLRMEPSNSIWNPTLFKPILSALISTQQIIESGDKLNEQTKNQLELAIILIRNLTEAILKRDFLNLIRFEFLLALDEITVKLITGMRPEFDKYNEKLSNECTKFIQTIAESKCTALLNDINNYTNDNKNDNDKNNEEKEDENNEKEKDNEEEDNEKENGKKDDDDNEKENNKKEEEDEKEKENKDEKEYEGEKNVREKEEEEKNEEEEEENKKKKRRKKKVKQPIKKTVKKTDHIDYILPFLVPQLLLQFASNSTTLTTKIDRIREKLTDLTIKMLKPEDRRLLIVCKHLICRCPDKSHLRRAVAQTIFSLSKSSKYIKEIINFIIRASKTTKIGTRSFSSLLVQLYLTNIGEINNLFGEDSSEIVINLSNVLKRQVLDAAPTVRAISLEGISQVIESISFENQFSAIIKSVIDNNGFIEEALNLRICDEKFVVRKAALFCIGQIIQKQYKLSSKTNNENDDNFNFLLNLIASRTRDRAVSIRQLAIRLLNSTLSIFKENKEVHLIWLDSVLPRIVDSEDTVQKEALDSVTANLLDPIIKGENEIFTSIMKQMHFDFMKNVFSLYKQKSINLSKISKALTKKLSVMHYEGQKEGDEKNEEELKEEAKTDISVWKLIEILTRVETSHFKPKEFTKLWKLRSEYKFPPEYYIILTHLKCQKQKIKNDCLKVIEQELQGNTRKFALLHGVIQLLSIQEENDNNSILKDLLLSCCTYINQMAQSDSTSEEDVLDLITTIYTLGEIVLLIEPSCLYDYNFIGVQLLISDNLPNGSIIPSNIRALAAISLGKLCIKRKDVSTSFVLAFAHLLSSANSDPSIKCDTLIVMCDLCVRYTALVDPHIVLMTNCFADESPIVRHQTLHVITKLVVEDYLKMRPLLFFKYIYAITDENESTATFARCCLFNVILTKIPDLLTSHFIDAIYYFSNEIKLPGIFESEEERNLFQINDKERRQNGLHLIISKMNDISAFQMIQLICKNLLNRYVKEEFNIYQHKNILDDAIFSLVELEDKMKQVMESEILNEDSITEKYVEVGKKIINDIHNNMIQNVLPILNFMHHMLRDLHSPLQSQLKQFYQRICIKNPNLIKNLTQSEPFLAAELKKEMEEQEIENENENDDENRSPLSSQFTTPQRRKKKTSFSTPLLSQIASTPRSKLCSPADKENGED